MLFVVVVWMFVSVLWILVGSDCIISFVVWNVVELILFGILMRGCFVGWLVVVESVILVVLISVYLVLEWIILIGVCFMMCIVRLCGGCVLSV